MAAVRVAVVGTGGIASRHGFALKENPNSEIIGAIERARALPDEDLPLPTDRRKARPSAEVERRIRSLRAKRDRLARELDLPALFLIRDQIGDFRRIATPKFDEVIQPGS